MSDVANQLDQIDERFSYLRLSSLTGEPLEDSVFTLHRIIQAEMTNRFRRLLAPTVVAELKNGGLDVPFTKVDLWAIWFEENAGASDGYLAIDLSATLYFGLPPPYPELDALDVEPDEAPDWLDGVVHNFYEPDVWQAKFEQEIETLTQPFLCQIIREVVTRLNELGHQLSLFEEPCHYADYSNEPGRVRMWLMPNIVFTNHLEFDPFSGCA